MMTAYRDVAMPLSAALALQHSPGAARCLWIFPLSFHGLNHPRVWH